MPIPSVPTPISCPQCGKRFVVNVRTVIDVGQEPELREEFLRGRVNQAACPSCGAGGTLAAPLVYHDPERELLVTYVPSEIGMSVAEQEQYVGSLVNAVMNSLPQEQRKAYFFQPKTALTLDGLYETILEAEGISREALQKQRQMVGIIYSLLDAMDDEERFDQLVDEHRDELTYEFFMLLSGMLDTEEEGDAAGDDATSSAAEQVKQIQALRSRLLDRVTPAASGAPPIAGGAEELLALLRDTEDEETWRTAVAVNRARLDYGFFQNLTGKIDAARAAGNTDDADQLTALRQRILEEIDLQNEMMREAEDQAGLLVMELSEAEDLPAAVRARKDDLDEVLIATLARYRAAAESRGDKTRSERLRQILDEVLAAVEEDLPPNARLMNQLARADYPDETGEVLERNRGLLNDEFLKAFDRAIESLGKRNEELAAHLREVRGQAAAKMAIQRL